MRAVARRLRIEVAHVNSSYGGRVIAVSGCQAVFEVVRRRCGVAAAVGVNERCPGARCPFWEADERLEASGRCSIEEVVPHLGTLPELAQYLLELRTNFRGVGDHHPAVSASLAAVL
jgi:hypothetical protein